MVVIAKNEITPTILNHEPRMEKPILPDQSAGEPEETKVPPPEMFIPDRLFKAGFRLSRYNPSVIINQYTSQSLNDIGR